MFSPEGGVTLEAHDPAVTVDDVLRELDLVTLHDHRSRRSVREREQARLVPAGGPVIPPG